MNWRASAALLFTILLACEEPTDVGIGIQPPGDSLGVAFVTQPVVSEVIWQADGRAATGSTFPFLFGSYTSPQTGTLRAEAYIEMLPGVALTADSVTVDSTVLFLDVSGNSFYGDTLASQRLRVRVLSDRVETSGLLSEPQTLRPEIVGVKEVTFAEFKTNTVRIRIDEFGERALPLVNRIDSIGEARFLEELPGLAVVPDGPGFVMRGTTLGTDAAGRPSQNATRVLMYYRTPRDTAALVITPFAQNAALVRTSYAVTSTRDGTPLAAFTTPKTTIPTAGLNNRGYVQGGTDFRTKIFFPGLETLRDSLNNGEGMAVVRAELSITALDTIPRPVPLRLSELDASGNLLRSEGDSLGVTEDLLLNELNESLSFPPDANYVYTLNITEYITSVINGVQENNGLMVGTSAINTAVGQVVFGGGAHPQSPMELRIYYLRLP